MPLTDSIRRYARDRQFWADYRAEDVWYGDGESGERHDLYAEPIEFTFGTSQLRLTFGVGLKVTVFVRRPDEEWKLVVTNEDGGHAMPHAFRWQEADLIGRVLALRDLEFPHPGLPLLLLEPFVLDLDPGDHAAHFPLAASAWRSLGLFSERRIQGMARQRPYHTAGFRWDRTPADGWVVVRDREIDQEYRFENNIPSVHSLRRTGGAYFPFAAWNALMADVEAEYASHRSPAAFRSDSAAQALAQRAADTGDLTPAAALADRLDEIGSFNPEVLSALRSGEPARAAWVLELLLGAPQGALVRRTCPADVPPPGLLKRLVLDVAQAGMSHVHGVVLPALREHALGGGGWGGGATSAIDPDTDPSITEGFWFEVTDLDAAVAVVRAALRERPDAYPARLWTMADEFDTLANHRLRFIPLDE